MQNFFKASAATVVIGLSIALPGVASATPLVDSLAFKRNAPTEIEQVRWRRGWGYGFGAGFLGGAIIGGALASPYYYPPGPYYPGPYYYPGPAYYGPGYGDATAYCMQRFRSYDPSSGTYLGYDGVRHPCP